MTDYSNIFNFESGKNKSVAMSMAKVAKMVVKKDKKKMTPFERQV